MDRYELGQMLIALEMEYQYDVAPSGKVLIYLLRREIERLDQIEADYESRMEHGE